ncbi:MAG: single-stranded DNA-binding protein [Candidatus Gracilibacteria bacterium]|nr:single-stranded DNA-binding protein [Candidatus Gracilibacteria bacterium]
MRSVNKVILIGNLTRDPELKSTQSGQAVATFGIATNREWMTSESDRKKSTEFHEIVAWAKLAELCHQHLRKGKLVYLEGYLKTRSWELEDGSGKRFRTEIVLQDMIMLEKREQDSAFAGQEAASGLASEATPEASEPSNSGSSLSADIDNDNIF